MNSKQSNLKRMDNVGIVVKSLDKVISFFTELGLKLEGRATNNGLPISYARLKWADNKLSKPIPVPSVSYLIIEGIFVILP